MKNARGVCRALCAVLAASQILSGCAAWQTRQNWPDIANPVNQQAYIEEQTQAKIANLTAMLGMSAPAGARTPSKPADAPAAAGTNTNKTTTGGEAGTTTDLATTSGTTTAETTTAAFIDPAHYK